METVTRKSIYRWVRILHRDIGFFVIGLTIIYCVSGIMLTFRDTGFLKTETLIEKNIEPGLRADQLSIVLHLWDMKLIDQNDKEIRFLKGTYNKKTGVVIYLSEEIPGLLRAFNSLHVASSRDSRSPFTLIYAGMLLFLAISSFWMYKPGTRLFKRGIITALCGMTISILLVAM